MSSEVSDVTNLRAVPTAVAPAASSWLLLAGAAQNASDENKWMLQDGKLRV